MTKNRQSNNRGMSLVELIVVIAVMAVMIGFASFSVSVLFGKHAQECAEKVSARIDSTKTGSMSRYNESMVLRIVEADGSRDEIKSDGIYADNFITTIKYNSTTQKPEPNPIADPETRKMGRTSVTVTAYLSDGTQFVLKKADETNSDPTKGECCAIVINFDRATGALDYVGVPQSETDLFNKLDGVYINKLTFSQLGRTYAINFVKDTGKHTLSRE